MYRNLILVSTLMFFYLEVILANTTLNDNCAKPQFACGECETELQTEINALINEITGEEDTTVQSKRKMKIKDGVTLESTLERIAEIMKKHNPKGENKLNWMMIGKSGSLQETSLGNPRIALKSPDSELWVTFNTDPNAAGYNAIELMRWDGKTGTYKFQEISFPSKSARYGHVDLSGARCVRCHREPMRPNWDTYRAWATIIPPRDDLLEAVNSPQEFEKVGKPDTNAEIYLNFLQQIEAAKSSTTKDERTKRLSVLEILRPGDGSTSQKIEEIKKEIEQQGWSRVRHFPPTNENKNYSPKTASLAGPAHLAFDQLMGQQMCQISTGLEKHPEFENFKYVLAGIMNCTASLRNQPSPEELSKYLPPSFDKVAKDFYSSGDSLNTPEGRIKVGESKGAVLQAVFEHTRATHNMSDTYKEDRHIDLLVQYNINKGPKIGRSRRQLLRRLKRATRAKNDARYLSIDKFSKVGPPWTAIKDPKGVKGVPEFDPGIIASLRYVLEPLGVNTGTWSMSLGKNVTDTTYTFSDQFYDILKQQPLFEKIMRSVPGSHHNEKCQNLQELSRQALAGTKRIGGVNKMPDKCMMQGDRPMAQIDMEKQTRDLVEKTCMTCHGTIYTSLPFNFDSLKQMKKALLAPAPGGNRTWADHIKIALSEDYATIGVPHRMPPRGWNYSGSVSGTEKNRRDNARRNIIHAYVDFVTSDKRRPNERYTCKHLYDVFGRPMTPQPGEPSETVQ